jgi:cell migration-inducing and hyaluronan-binding protein
MHSESITAAVPRQTPPVSGIKSLRLLFFAMLFGVAIGQAASAQVTICATGALPPGTGGDLIVSGPGTCTVNAGTYLYHNVNIILGGTLLFTDAKIDFWAESILVENTGSLIAGKTFTPIGTAGGLVTFHLYGPDQGTSGTAQGIPCKTPGGTCGVPTALWNSNSMNVLDPTSCVLAKDVNGYGQNLPGNVNDCFYAYMPLDYDGGGTTPGYFGYKVLAVSYGGTLQLFGKKGATYLPGLLPASSGTSWARLNQNAAAGATTLVLDRAVDWQANDQVVVTTTDYLPGHSELMTIQSVSTTKGTTTLTLAQGLAYSHNGQTLNIGSTVPTGIGPDQDPNVTCSSGQTRCVETRAAVGLLTRSIQIVSGGNTLQSNFPSSSNCISGDPPTCSSTAGDCYFFGGHTIVRQGFRSYQVQGVEFYQQGQGGRIMHYPVHFHMARQTPVDTFVMDSSVWDSMTRMYTIHATQGVTLARNVGYLSVGHGYYLEDGTETGNKFYSNLGVMARAAVINTQNPRCVPGILAAAEPPPPAGAPDQVPYSTDVVHPTSFWIMNGWNDFEYNMAAGATGCGMCYWLTPGGNSGNSRYEYWGTGYAAEQQVDTQSRYGTTPLKTFTGNSCVSAQNAFFTIGPSTPCLGLVSNGDVNAPLIAPVPNPLAPAITSNQAINYYPQVSQGGARTPTVCPSGLDCGSNSSVPICAAGPGLANCTITALDRFTTSFNWAETGFAALWLRQQWYLVSNSAITDVQNGGLTFVSGGGYTDSDEVPGYWALAHKDVFIGTTQPGNPYAMDAGPFNIYSLKLNPTLTCSQNLMGQSEAAYCMNANQGISFTLENFGVNQRLFNIYDGPSFQDSNAYLNITKRVLAGCNTSPGNGGPACQTMGWMYGNVTGVPLDPFASSNFQAYLPNAAIAWKQPNGFYYPPAFDSTNLFFNNVDIRHFVIEPLFDPETYDTDGTLTQSRYFNSAGGAGGPTGMFNGFTDIDRQTELTDVDGSLTGLMGAANQKSYLPTISVNKDNFFNAPVATVECASDIKDNMPAPWGNCNLSQPLCGTANTSPYDYVTTVVYPATTATDGTTCDPIPNWTRTCTMPNCYGVPLYREGLVPSDNGTVPFIRMAGQTTCQRSSLTVNNGNYCLDTAVSATTQNSWNEFGAPAINVFTGGYTYYTFLLFAKPTTSQTYSMYVGTDFNPSDPSQLWVTRVDKSGTPYAFAKDTVDTIAPCSSRKAGSDFAWCYNYSSTTGILAVTMNMGFSGFAQNYTQAVEEHCGPVNYCAWNQSQNSCGCVLSSKDPGYKECKNACSNWAGAAIDCPWDSSDFSSPRPACYGIGLALPIDFVASENGTSSPPGQCLPNNPTWNVPFTAASSGTAGTCAYSSSMLPTGTFCSNAMRK